MRSIGLPRRRPAAFLCQGRWFGAWKESLGNLECGIYAAILIAASSNNILKVIYAIGFAGRQAAISPAVVLVLLALAGGGAAWWFSGAPLPPR